jgi:ubiquinone/menaquinone biosynthesis C-methylase UbiE
MNKTQKFYDETAKDFHQRNKAKDLSCEYKEFEKHMGSGSRLLDLGCGPGRDAKYFSNEGFDVTGVDFSSAMLEIAKVEAPKANFKLFDIEHDNPKELEAIS